ncbi:MAG: galactokinase, partial [FCB group bacterium]|nr:galactokinase [FCB group bacterium]
NVGIGSGLSSSASFEVLMGTIINDLYNNNEIPQPHIARIGQFAENQYFGKPCGLMDQTACAVGSILKIDFADPHNINIWKINTNMEASDFVLLVVDTGGSHADLTSAYSSIPAEMKAVAGELGSQVLRDQSPDILMDSISAVRTKLGDRAALRALHYFSENKRVDKMVSALESGDFAAYLKQVSASGLSSQNILQNVIPPGNQGKNQNYALALGLSQLFIEEKGRGVVRVHGGGYAGTVQAYIHRGDFDEYKLQLESIFGGNAVERLIIRHQGSRSILQLN